MTLAQLEQAFDQADGNNVDWQALQQATRPQQTSQPARTRATRLTPEQVNTIAESLQAMVAADEEYSDLQVSFVSVPTSIPRQLISQFNGKKYAIAIQFQGAAPNRRVFYMVGEEAENFLRDMALDDIYARLKAKVGEQTDVEYTVAIHFVTEA